MGKFKPIRPFFKMHRKNGHPSYIYAENEEEYKYIGITHASTTHGLENKRLRYNPNSLDSKPSHARSFSTHDLKDNFRKSVKKGFKLHKADKGTIRRIKKNYKK